MYKDILNSKCLVYCKGIGTSFGKVTDIDKETVRLENSFSITQWEANSCFSNVANDGMMMGKTSPLVKTKILNGCCEIIPCTTNAIKRIETVMMKNMRHIVLCKTKDEASTLLGILKGYGYDMSFGKTTSNPSETWERHKENTCYRMANNEVYHDSCENYKGMTIMTLQEFLERYKDIIYDE